MPTLLDFCRPEDFAELFARAPALVRPAVAQNRSGPLPDSVVDGALAAGEPGIAALLENGKALEEDPGLRRRAAASGSPLIAEALCAQGGFWSAWSRRECELLFDSADPADPRWRGPSGAVAYLLQAEPDRYHKDRSLQISALGSPFPDLVRHALRLWGERLERRELLRGVRALHEHGGPDALRAALDDPGLRSALPEPVRDLAERALKGEEGAAELRAAAEEANGTAAAVEELRAAEAEFPDLGSDWVDVRLEVRGGADWAVLAAAHRELPFTPEVIKALVRHPDCPEDLLVELIRTTPGSNRYLERSDRPLSLREITALLPELRDRPQWAVLERTRERDREQGVTGDAADWAALAAANRAETLPVFLSEYLVQRSDCPDEVLVELVSDHASPNKESRVEGVERPLSAAALTALAGIVSPRAATRLCARSLGRTLTAREVLHELRPAPVALQIGAALAVGDGRARAEWDAVGDELAVLLADTVGADPLLWRALRRKAGRARGTVAELLAEVARGKAADGPWPDAAEMPPVTGARPAGQARTAFAVLLGALPAEDQDRLLDRVDDRTAHDLFTQGWWRPEWPEWVRAGRRQRDRVALSRRPGLPAEAVRVLAELDDPAVNAGLLYQEAAPREVRDALLAGVPLGPERPDRSERLPLDPGFRTELLKGASWRWLYPVAGCGDPEILDLIEAKDLRTDPLNLRLRIRLGLWERNGRGHCPRHEDPGAYLVPEADRAEDDEEAVELMRSAVAEAESAKKLIRRLRTSSRRIDRIAAERLDWDWDALLEAHLRSPFSAGRATELARLPGCPEPIREGLGRMTKPEQRAHRRLAEGVPPEKALAKVALSGPGPGRPWPLLALDQGLLTPADLVRHGRPVGAVLGMAGTDDRVREAVAEAVRPLDGHPDAWMLALQMLDGFPDTLPTLVRTALTAVGAEQ
ncbi:hypothetical protein [Nocardiopsis potens]|uniref:hypothetical protein n=1 Tax=Nocardiopsis potens TaxID=1246458 RepID=UPI0003451D46|nr:hypothetical protein [Nocardiopsis potens]